MKKPNLQKLLKHWQHQLGLRDWDITIRYANQDEFQDNDSVGQNHFSATNKESVILVLEPAQNKSDFPRLHDVELTVIHELIHCIINNKMIKTGRMEEATEHVAKAFRGIYASS